MHFKSISSRIILSLVPIIVISTPTFIVIVLRVTDAQANKQNCSHRGDDGECVPRRRGSCIARMNDYMGKPLDFSEVVANVEVFDAGVNVPTGCLS
jgi:hypothetical protein